MSKAKSIDRLELTRKKFGLASTSKQEGKTAKEVAEELFTELVDKPRRGEKPSLEILNMQKHKTLSEITGLPPMQNLSTCPECGYESVIHESGCMRCLTCGWSACK